MLKLQKRGGRFYYSIFLNPVARVMKFENFHRYFQALPQGGTVLDYGAGDRPMEHMLLTKFETYVAADYAPSNEAHTARPDILITDEGLQTESETVDCVVLTEVLEHIYTPKAALSEINRILKPGGVVIGTVPFAVGEHEAPYDFHRYTSYCLRRMFEESGFEIRQLEYVGDTVGVTLTGLSRVLGIGTKLLHKFRLKPVAIIFDMIIRIPEILYYGLSKLGAKPSRIDFYKVNPMGFSFYVVKSGAKTPTGS